MHGLRSAKTAPVLGVLLAAAGLGACNTGANTTGSTRLASTRLARPVAATEAERDCLGRAMYFESQRSDPEGLLAVGTVVMNRLEAAAAPGGICAVVGRPRQFAAGVLTKPMEAKDLQRVADVTDAVLDGARHPKVGRALHFHTAGLRFPYGNMHYVAVAGGNAFYEKRRAGASEPAPTTLAMAAPPAPVPTPLAYAAAAEPETVLDQPAQDICRVGGAAGAG